MKLDKIDDDNYKVFININYLDDFDIENNDELGKYIKSIILKLRKLYGIILEGYYEVHVYIIKWIGIILEIKNIDNYISKTIDLKIVVHNNEEVYLKVYRYELVEQYRHLKYFANRYYVNIDDVLEKDVISLIENSKIVYGNDVDLLRSKWFNLT